MSQLLTQSIQDYLKHIYEFNETGGAATTTGLAERLDVTPASVTGMLRRLASSKPPLVVYKKHQGVTLTKEGRRAALEVIRHHRLLEAYLVRMLGYSWDEVHDEACRLEHVISEDFETRIAAAMGNPTRDPHGDLIPSENLAMPPDDTLPLAALRIDETATVRRVSSEKPALLRHLWEIGVVPEARVTAIEVSELDGNLTLKIEGKGSEIVLGRAITDRVFVEKQDRSGPER